MSNYDESDPASLELAAQRLSRQIRDLELKKLKLLDSANANLAQTTTTQSVSNEIQKGLYGSILFGCIIIYITLTLLILWIFDSYGIINHLFSMTCATWIFLSTVRKEETAHSALRKDYDNTSRTYTMQLSEALTRLDREIEETRSKHLKICTLLRNAPNKS